MKRVVLAFFFGMLALSAWALPSIDAVQAEIAKGRYTQAEAMMREVIVAKPGSARAHYVYAELLAHDKRFDKAIEEAALARKLDPDIRFTQPEKFDAFVQLLDREQGGARAVAPAPRAQAPEPVRQEQALPASEGGSGGVPGWLWGLGAAVLAVVAWRAYAARRPSPVAAAPAGAAPGWPAGPVNPAQAPGYASGPASAYGPAAGSYTPGVPPAGRNGLLGTGLAVAGGVAAGMLAEKLFEGHRETPSPWSNAGGGGLAPGNFNDPAPDNAAARELEQRPIDSGTGTGSDGWGADDADTGSSSDDGGW